MIDVAAASHKFISVSPDDVLPRPVAGVSLGSVAKSAVAWILDRRAGYLHNTT